MKFLITIALILPLSLTSTQVDAGKLKKIFIGGALVAIGVGGTIIYQRGQANEREKWASDTDVEEKNSEFERLKNLSSDTWERLASGIPINESLIDVANDLRRSTSITVLDTSAFTFAEMGDRQTALDIYKYRIFPILLEEEPKNVDKYEKHYSVLLTCQPGECIKMLYSGP